MRTEQRNGLIMLIIGVIIIFVGGLLMVLTSNEWMILVSVIGFGLMCSSCLLLLTGDQSSRLKLPKSKDQKIEPKSINNSKDDDLYKICPYCRAKVTGYFCTECGNKIE